MKTEGQIDRRTFLKAAGVSVFSIGGSNLLALDSSMKSLESKRPEEAKSGQQEGPHPFKNFAANLWISPEFVAPNVTHNRFGMRGRIPFKMFLESILLHDQIVLPTHDFMILASLRLIFGDEQVIKMLEMGCLRFIRVRGAMGCAIYQDGSWDIESWELTFENNTKPAWSAPIEDVVEWAISAGPEPRSNPQLARLIVENTDEFKALSVVKTIRDETYKDIQESEYLRNSFQLPARSDHGRDRAPLKHIMVYSGRYSEKQDYDVYDEFMMIAQTNLELYLAQAYECIDTSTANPVGHLLKAKAQRSFDQQKDWKDFAILKEIADIPDIGEGVLLRQIHAKRLLKLRYSTNGEQFRKWFHQSCRDNAVQTAKEYVSLLREVPKIQSFPVKVLRFIVTSLLPGSYGLIGGAVDSFLIEDLLKGNSPKYFIEELSQLKGAYRKDNFQQ